MGGFGAQFGPEELQNLMQDLEKWTTAGEKWTGPSSRAARGSDANPMSFRVDIQEAADTYTFFADLPGVSRSETKVQANKEERQLIISGHRIAPEAGDETRRRRSERRFGKFRRNFTLPEDADLNAVSARFKDGVLEVTVKRVKPVEPEVNEVPIDDWIDIDTSPADDATDAFDA